MSVDCWISGCLSSYVSYSYITGLPYAYISPGKAHSRTQMELSWNVTVSPTHSLSLGEYKGNLPDICYVVAWNPSQVCLINAIYSSLSMMHMHGLFHNSAFLWIFVLYLCNNSLKFLVDLFPLMFHILHKILRFFIFTCGEDWLVLSKTCFF